MPLSEYEKQVLAQMERQLASDDPKLASRLGEETSRRVGRMVVGVLAVIVGLVVLVVGVMWQPWLGILGFLLMLGGVWFALFKKRDAPGAADRAGDGAPGAAQGKGRPGGKPARSSFMSRMEARWDKRRSGGML